MRCGGRADSVSPTALCVLNAVGGAPLVPVCALRGDPSAEAESVNPKGASSRGLLQSCRRLSDTGECKKSVSVIAQRSNMLTHWSLSASTGWDVSESAVDERRDAKTIGKTPAVLKKHRRRKNPAGRIAPMMPPLRSDLLTETSSALANAAVNAPANQCSVQGGAQSRVSGLAASRLSLGLSCSKGNELAARDQALDSWLSGARCVLEQLMILRRTANDQHSGAKAISKKHILLRDKLSEELTRLQDALELLSQQHSFSEAVQEASRAMLAKMQGLVNAIAAEFAETTDCEYDRRRARKSKLRIPDAHVVVAGPDGKKMYFKHRESCATHNVKACCQSESQHGRDVFLANTAPLSPLFAPVRFSSALRSLRQCGRPQWRLLRVRYLHGRRVIVKARWAQLPSSTTAATTDIDGLEISVYNPNDSSSTMVRLPTRFLPLFRTHQSESAVEAVFDDIAGCVRDALRCCYWKDGRSVSVKCPIQHRQARIFSYRTYATIPALVSVCVSLDESCEVAVVDAHTMEERLLSLSATQISRVLGTNFLEAVGGSLSVRREAFQSICRKLFVEYTSQGFEVLFPGTKPRGNPRRHPAELAVLKRIEEQAFIEREAATRRMYICALQAAAIGKRAHMKRQQRREEAAQRLQANVRLLIRQRQAQRCRRLQIAAVVVIQQRVRQMLARRRVQRRRQAHDRNLARSSFRLACRINKTFSLVNVRAVSATECELHDTKAIDELRISVCHPVSGDLARMFVSRDVISRVMDAGSSAPVSRRALVDHFVRQHLDVFRSARCSLLVVALRRIEDDKSTREGVDDPGKGTLARDRRQFLMDG